MNRSYPPWYDKQQKNPTRRKAGRMADNSTLKRQMPALREILKSASDAENVLSTNDVCWKPAARSIRCERKGVSTGVALLVLDGACESQAPRTKQSNPEQDFSRKQPYNPL